MSCPLSLEWGDGFQRQEVGPWTISVWHNCKMTFFTLFRTMPSHASDCYSYLASYALVLYIPWRKNARGILRSWFIYQSLRGTIERQQKWRIFLKSNTQIQAKRALSSSLSINLSMMYSLEDRIFFLVLLSFSFISSKLQVVTLVTCIWGVALSTWSLVYLMGRC